MPEHFDDGLAANDNERYPDEPDDPDLLRETGRGVPATSRTASFRAFLESLGPEEIVSRCRDTIAFMASMQLDLTLLNYYCTGWVLPEAVDDPVIQYARTGLMWSEELPTMLKNWHHPPRRHAVGIRTRAANNVMESISEDIVKRKINREMREIAPAMRSPPSDLREETLMFNVDDMIAYTKKTAPTFWSILRSASFTPEQERINKQKNPDLSIMMSISTASFSRSHHRCKFQKLLGIHFKACMTSARGLDTLSALGISMSQSWIYNGLEALSEAANSALRKSITCLPWSGGHDNMNIRFVSYQQRLDNPSHFDSGTIGTIFIHNSPDTARPSNPAYQQQWAIGSKNPINTRDIFRLGHDASVRLRTQSVFHVLQFLKGAAPFDFDTYAHKDSAVFARPLSVFQLPTGPEHSTTQYMLSAVHIDEATYEGNAACFTEWWRQLGVTSLEDMQRASKQDTTLWKGDQLTTQRLRGLKRFNSQDLNAWERRENILEMFGWFHVQITVGHSFHQQYYGTTAGMGLRRDFDLLKRRGLAAPSTQGNFHQTLTEALLHIAEARFRDLWCVVAHVNSIEDLRNFSPEKLEELAYVIVDKHASTAALTAHRLRPRALQDDVQLQAMQFARDIFDFLILDDTVRSGDVGIMKLLLPRLLHRFLGGGHSNYTVETLEVMQGFEREWPDDLQDFMLRSGWLANTGGHEDTFIPFDKVQEHNIKDAKCTMRTIGPYKTWEYLGRTSGSIPTQRNVKDHVERQFNQCLRGKKHTNPEKETDVAALQDMYSQSNLHRYDPRRKIEKEDQIHDYVAKGCDPILLKTLVSNWQEKRLKSRAVTEDWVFGYEEATNDDDQMDDVVLT